MSIVKIQYGSALFCFNFLPYICLFNCWNGANSTAGLCSVGLVFWFAGSGGIRIAKHLTFV